MPSNELDSLLREQTDQLIEALSVPLGAPPALTVCEVPESALMLDSLRRAVEFVQSRERIPASQHRAKPFPWCCNLEMVEAFDRAVFVCQRGGCARIVTVVDWLEERVTPKQAWRPTVPHPLLQIDEELRR